MEWMSARAKRDQRDRAGKIGRKANAQNAHQQQSKQELNRCVKKLERELEDLREVAARKDQQIAEQQERIDEQQ